MKYFTAILLLLWKTWTCKAQAETGVIFSSETAQSGYVLFAPLQSRVTYLIDKNGNPRHTWRSEWLPAQSAYLLPDGTLLRTGVDTSNRYFPRSGGWIEKLDPMSRVLWSYLISDKNQRRHHDIYPLVNGNILVLVWEKKTREEAVEAGRNPALLGNTLWTEKIVELCPKGRDSADVVWKWEAWDHLVQDLDKEKGNYGKIDEHPELININFLASTEADWLHFNSISYNEKLDQIVVSSRNFSEFFVIDHSTTTTEAASHKGGKSLKGGDILYRWGNPGSYNRGTGKDQKLFSQHNVHWIEGDAENKIMVFNNGLKRPGGEYSSVEILDPPYNKDDTYKLKRKKAYLPDRPSRLYKGENTSTFFSQNISSAQQLPNGDILICEGVKGKFFEIDKNNKIVWLYVNPFPSAPGQNRNTGGGPIFKCVFYDRSYPGISAVLGKRFNPSATRK